MKLGYGNGRKMMLVNGSGNTFIFIDLQPPQLNAEFFDAIQKLLIKCESSGFILSRKVSTNLCSTEFLPFMIFLEIKKALGI
jgi:hypothetical protein